MGGLKVLALRDYDRSVRIIGDRKEKLALPKSNVLYCELEQNCWFCARPSRDIAKAETVYRRARL